MTKPADLGVEVRKFLEEIQTFVSAGWRNMKKIGAMNPNWQKGATMLSNLQRLHDLVEALYPSAHEKAKEKAEEIAGGTEENEESSLREKAN